MNLDYEASKEEHGPCLFRPMVEELRITIATLTEKLANMEQNTRILKTVDSIDPAATQYVDAVLKAVDRAEAAEERANSNFESAQSNENVFRKRENFLEAQVAALTEKLNDANRRDWFLRCAPDNPDGLIFIQAELGRAESKCALLAEALEKARNELGGMNPFYPPVFTVIQDIDQALSSSSSPALDRMKALERVADAAMKAEPILAGLMSNWASTGARAIHTDLWDALSALDSAEKIKGEHK